MTLSTHVIGAGRPLVVLPWFGMDHAATAVAFEPAFAEPGGWRRIYVDLPGTGDSPLVEPHSDAVLDAVIATIAAVAPGAVTLAGCSYGGYLAAAVARRAPERVTGLLLVCAGVKIRPADRNLSDVLASTPEPGWLDGVPAGLHGYFGLAVGNQTTEVATRLADAFARSAPTDDDFLGRLRSTGYPLSDEATRRPFDGHVTAVSGRRDRIAGFRDQFDAMDLYPHGDFTALADAGHFLPFEQPTAFASLVQAWLSRR